MLSLAPGTCMSDEHMPSGEGGACGRCSEVGTFGFGCSGKTELEAATAGGASSPCSSASRNDSRRVRSQAMLPWFGSKCCTVGSRAVADNAATRGTLATASSLYHNIGSFAGLRSNQI